jgi:hypothetical protein
MLRAMGAAPIMGCLMGGDKKRLLDLCSAIKADQFLEDGVSASKLMGKRELKNLECSINFDTRSSGSSWGKGRTSACSVGLGLFNFCFSAFSCILCTRVMPLCTFDMQHYSIKKKKKSCLLSK